MMKLRTYSLLVIGLCPALALAQSATERECRTNVANALNLGPSNVGVSTGGNGENGSPVVQWNADLGGRRIVGFCETNRNGRVTSTQLGQFYGSGGGFGRGNNNNGNNNNGRGNDGSIFGRGDAGGAVGNVAVRPVDVDTAGRGTLNAMGQTVRLTRGWVDTRTTPTFSLSGDNNFKITFTGNVVSNNGDREFNMRITGSDRGNATGNAVIRLNSSREEVEYIQVDGRVGNRPVTGTFNRN